MGSLIGEEWNFKNGDISSPKCKRRKVSAVRTFPSGCGPNAASKCKQTKVKGVQGVNKPNTDVVLAEVGPKFPPVENPNILEEIQIFEEKNILRDEKYVSSNNLVQGCLECPILLKDSSAADPEELANVADDKMDERTNEEQNLLPYYPIPSNLVWKERKYPTPRRVSAVCDFPAGCGRNLTSHCQNSQVVGGENKGSLEGGKIDEETIQGIVSGKSRDTHEKPSKVDGIAENVVEIEKGVIVLGLLCTAFLTSHCQKYQVVGGENQGSLEGGKNDEDTIQGIVSGKSRDTHEKPSKVDGIAENVAVEIEKGVIVLGLSCAAFSTSHCQNYQVVGGENKGSLEGGKNNEDTIQGVVSGKSRDTHEKPSKVDGIAENVVEIEKGVIVLGLSCAAFLMSHCQNYQVVGGENKGSLEGGRSDQDTIHGIVSGKSRDTHEKPSKVDGIAGNVAVIEIEKGDIVLGLSCAAFCPFQHLKRPAKLSLSRVNEKEFNGKKRGYDAQDNQKCSLTKHEDSEMLSGIENVAVFRQLALGDDEDYSKDEEYKFESLPCTHDCDVTLAPFVACSSIERGARTKVREVLRLFQALVRKILQGEETNSKENRNAGKSVHSKAANILKKEGKYINTEKVIGPVPGIEIGDTFSYRVELASIGLHSPRQGDIDTIKLGNLYFATSVVASRSDDNDVDNPDVLIYTGQGGNQMLDRGNLALQNCIDNKNPVRVIRSFEETEPSDDGDWKPKMITTYTYDGLYTVERYWHQWISIGPHGNLVYRFELIRIPGQQPLALKKCKTSDGVCVDDISNGKESFPIRAVNTKDDEKPPPFTYITSTIYPDWCRPLPLKGCECKTDCCASKRCSCTIKNGGEIPYNLSGAIVEAKDLVYECGPSCDCPPSCPNRVSQHGIKLPLEIFQTDSMGWGVRCHSPIPSGSFICEYIGELLDDREAEQRVGSDEYLFDIGQNYNDLMSVVPEIAKNVENIGFTIDAASYGNIGRFVNHSCSPNLYAQNVLYDHEDKRIPHVMLFAAEDIPPLQELTYHYNYTIDQVFDSKGKIKKKNCYCGSAECTGRMY